MMFFVSGDRLPLPPNMYVWARAPTSDRRACCTTPQTVDCVRCCQPSSDPPGPPPPPITQVDPPRSPRPARRHQPAPPFPRLHCAAASVGGVRATHPQRRNNNHERRPPPAPPPVWSTTRHARAGCAGRRDHQRARFKTRAPPWPGALATRRGPPLLLSCCTTRRSQRRRRGESSCSTSAASRWGQQATLPPDHGGGMPTARAGPSVHHPTRCAISPQKRRRVGATPCQPAAARRFPLTRGA